MTKPPNSAGIVVTNSMDGLVAGNVTHGAEVGVYGDNNRSVDFIGNINSPLEPSSQIKKQWHERLFGFMVATIFCGLVVAFCAYYFGWTK